MIVRLFGWTMATWSSPVKFALRMRGIDGGWRRMLCPRYGCLFGIKQPFQPTATLPESGQMNSGRASRVRFGKTQRTGHTSENIPPHRRRWVVQGHHQIDLCRMRCRRRPNGNHPIQAGSGSDVFVVR